MNKTMINIFNEINVDKLLHLLDTESDKVTRFCFLYEGDDIFFQQCRERKVKLGTYMYYERKMLDLCRKLYFMNQSADVLAIQASNSDNLVHNPYARLTMSLEDRKMLNHICWQCVKIDCLSYLFKLVRCGCRCVGTTYLYFVGLDICLIIDELGGVIFGQRDTAKNTLDGLDVPYEINPWDVV